MTPAPASRTSRIFAFRRKISISLGVRLRSDECFALAGERQRCQDQAETDDDDWRATESIHGTPPPVMRMSRILREKRMLGLSQLLATIPGHEARNASVNRFCIKSTWSAITPNRSSRSSRRARPSVVATALHPEGVPASVSATPNVAPAEARIGA